MTDLTAEEQYPELLRMVRTIPESTPPTRLCLLSSAMDQQEPRDLLLVHIYIIPFSFKSL